MNRRPAALFGGVGAGVVDQHAAHHARRDTVEVRTVLPTDSRLVNEPKVRLVDEGGRLQGVRAAFSGEKRAREAPHLVVDERHQALGRMRVAAAPVVKDLGDFVLSFAAHRP
jgi:hypothetical protein